MLIAECNGEIVEAKKDLLCIGNYICPECKKKLIFKNGEIKIPHFAHPRDTECTYYQYCQNESPEHKNYKLQIKEYLLRFKDIENIQIEYKAISNRIADIYFEVNKEKYVIEIQCSRITIEEYISRTQDYNKNGIYVMWIWDSMLLNTYIHRNREEILMRKNSVFDFISTKDQCDMFIQKPILHDGKENLNIFMAKKISRWKNEQGYNPNTRQKYIKEVEKNYYYMIRPNNIGLKKHIRVITTNKTRSYKIKLFNIWFFKANK